MANTMTRTELLKLAAHELARLGGLARARALSPEERSAIARRAVQARWARAAKRRSRATA